MLTSCFISDTSPQDEGEGKEYYILFSGELEREANVELSTLRASTVIFLNVGGL